MVVHQSDLACEDFDALVGLVRFGTAAVMYYRCRRSDLWNCAELARPQTKVGLFTVHEECRIEPVKLVPKVAVNKEKAAGDYINRANRVALPSTISFRIKEHTVLLQAQPYSV